MSKKSTVDSKRTDAKGSSRRKAIKTVALGGGAVVFSQTKWSKPVVDSVILPAHAQASGKASSVTNNDSVEYYS